MYAGKRKALVTNTNPDIVVKAHLYCWHWGMRMIAIILGPPEPFLHKKSRSEVRLHWECQFHDKPLVSVEARRWPYGLFTSPLFLSPWLLAISAVSPK